MWVADLLEFFLEILEITPIMTFESCNSKHLGWTEGLWLHYIAVILAI